MALKAVLQTLDQVPEALRAHYQARDGVFVLSIDGIDDHPGVGELKRALDRQKADRAKAQDDVKALRQEFLDFGGPDPATIAEMRGTLEDLEREVSARGTRIDELERGRRTMTAELADHKIFSALRRAARDGGAKMQALTDIENRARLVWRIEDGEPRAFEGEAPMIGRDGALTLNEWIDGLRREAPYLFEENRGADAQGGARATAIGVRLVAPNQAGDDIAAIAKGEARIAS